MKRWFNIRHGMDGERRVYSSKYALSSIAFCRLTSVSSVAKLGYAVLVAFESTASHLFDIRFDGKRFEIVFEEDDFDDEPAIDPIKIKLSTLKFSVGDKPSGT